MIVFVVNKSILSECRNSTLITSKKSKENVKEIQ